MRLELKNVRQCYGQKVVIDNLNLVFKPGIYGFMGPNGAGKSTTIRMLCTVEEPVSGGIYYNGDDIYGMGEEYRDKIGYVPQKAGYYPDFNAYTFLRYIVGLKGVEQADEVIERYLKLVGLWEEREKKLKKYSGGMKQRINIAQALLNDPEILILDEPTVGLDPNERMNLKNMLADLAQNKIIIFATHIVSDVEDLAEQVIILNKGTVLLNEEMETAVSHIENKVWQCDLTDMEEINRIKKMYQVSRVQRHKGVATIRVISDTKPHEDAFEVDGSIEELYMQLIESRASHI